MQFVGIPVNDGDARVEQAIAQRDEGGVLRSSPAPGTELKPDTAVDLYERSAGATTLLSLPLVTTDPGLLGLVTTTVWALSDLILIPEMARGLDGVAAPATA